MFAKILVDVVFFSAICTGLWMFDAPTVSYVAAYFTYLIVS